MGLFTRARLATSAARMEPTFRGPVEQRADPVSYGPGWAGLAAMAGTAGTVSPVMAENLAAVGACVRAISSGLAALPARVYRQQDAGRVEVFGHPVAALLRAPNAHQTWPDWVEWTLAQVLLWGNALSAVVFDGAGRPVELRPIPWSTVAVTRLPSGRLAYDANGTRYLEGEVFHLRDRSDDGIVGRSCISRAPAVLQAAGGLQTFSTAVWDNAAAPSGMVTMPSNIPAASAERVRSFYEARYTGAANARKVLFGDAGTTFTPISCSPEDAEVLASRLFSVIEICRLFNVPPPIVQDYSHATFTNASQASTWHATNTLTPWARKLEAEFSRSVIGDPAVHIEVDLSGLVRGDYSTRWTANVAAVTAGILTKDEVREQEGYGPLSSTSPEPSRPLS